MYPLIHLGSVFCPEVSQLLVISLRFSRFLPSCCLLFSGGVICWALAVLLSPSHLLCTCSLVSTAVCMDFSLSCGCKETASCSSKLRQPKRGRHVTSPETQGSCCGIAAIPGAFTSFPFPATADDLSFPSALCAITCPAGPQEQVGSPLLAPSGCWRGWSVREKG